MLSRIGSTAFPLEGHRESMMPLRTPMLSRWFCLAPSARQAPRKHGTRRHNSVLLLALPTRCSHPLLCPPAFVGAGSRWQRRGCMAAPRTCRRSPGSDRVRNGKRRVSASTFPDSGTFKPSLFIQAMTLLSIGISCRVRPRDCRRLRDCFGPKPFRLLSTNSAVAHSVSMSGFWQRHQAPASFLASRIRQQASPNSQRPRWRFSSHASESADGPFLRIIGERMDVLCFDAGFVGQREGPRCEEIGDGSIRARLLLRGH